MFNFRQQGSWPGSADWRVRHQQNIAMHKRIPWSPAASQPAPVRPNPIAQAPRPVQPEFQNDFVYKRPTFGMQRQMTSAPSMDWRLGN